MRISKVIGTVTLSRSHPTLVGSRLKLIVPLSLANLRGESELAADDLVAWDDLGAGIGDLIATSEGAEAAQPFRPDLKPIDAYNAAILDRVEVEVRGQRLGINEGFAPYSVLRTSDPDL